MNIGATLTGQSSLKIKLNSILFISVIVFCIWILLGNSSVFAGTDVWTTNGPYGGEIRSLVISPNFPIDNTVFAGSNKGIFKSINGGSSWTAVLASNYIYSLAVSPSFAIDNTIFVGTNGGIYKSTNGGSSWSAAITNFIGIRIKSLAISPNYTSDNTIFAGTDGSGVYKSTDGGANWTQINTGLTDTNVRSVALSPSYTSDNTIFAGTDGGGIFKSTDGGANWTQVNSGFTNTNVYSVALSPNYASDNTIFAGTRGGGGEGIYKSTNGGSSWTQVNSGLTKTAIWSVALSPSYTSDNTIFAGTLGGGIFKSTDGGANWTQINTGLLTNSSVYSFALSPNYASDNTIFAGVNYGGGGGTYKSTNGGSSWSVINTGITSARISSLAFSPNFSIDNIIFTGAGWQGIFKSINGGSSWTAVNSGFDPAYISFLAFSPNFPIDNTIFAGAGWQGIIKSTNGGSSWTAVLASNYIYSLAVSPSFAIDNTIFAGTGYGIFKSINGGSSWSAVNTDITNTRISLAFSPNFSIDNTIFAGSINGIIKSTNGGSSWSAINTGIANPSISSLSISPNFAIDNTVFAGTWYSGVFKTNNGGSSWSAVNTGITDSKILRLAISPNFAIDNTVFAVCNYDIFRSTNGGSSWSAFNTGITDGEILHLAVSPNFAIDNTVLAGTDYGVFSYTFSDTTDTTPPTTQGSINPVADGDNGWYKTTPTVTLTPNEPADTYYQWDSNNPLTWIPYSVPISVPEGQHVLYYYSEDTAENVETEKISGQIKVDTENPTDPNVSSTSHIVGIPSSDQTIDITLSGASDSTSDVDGFSIEWSQSDSTIPDNIDKELEENETTTTSEALSPGTWYFHLRTKDNAGNWTSTVHLGPFEITPADQWITNGPEGGKIWSIAVSPNYASDNTVFAGAWNGGVYRSTNGGSSWINVGFPYTTVRSLSLSPNYAVDNTVFAATQGIGVRKSANGGSSWIEVNTGLTTDDVLSIAVSPNYASDNTVFAGTGGRGVAKSTDGGANWTEFRGGLQNTGINSIAVSPNYAFDNTVFAGTNGGVHKSTNGGSSWTYIGPGTVIRSVALSPDFASDNTVFTGTEYPSKVFKSTNGGSSWVETSLINSNVYSFAFSPNYAVDNTVVAATQGIDTRRSTDGGVTWTAIDDSLYVSGRSVALSPDYASDNTVFAGTWGDGVFSYTFSADTTPPETQYLISPPNPDGDNGWYKTTPLITLTPNEQANTYYQWDSNNPLNWLPYSVPISVPEGQHVLYYYSEDTSGNIETEKTSPQIKVDTAAYPTIQEALDAAASGDIIEVADGTYYENIIWPATDNITLKSINGADTTIIDGSRAQESAIYVGNGQKSVSIEGFTIKNGYGSIPTYHSTYRTGGGILIDELVTATIKNCKVLENGGSAGIFVSIDSFVIIQSCEIVNNDWIGVYYRNFISGEIRNSIIAGNGWHGIYAQSSPINIYNNTISNNTADGLAFYVPWPDVQNNIISFNGEYAIHSNNSDDTDLVKYNDLWSNSSGDYIDITMPYDPDIYIIGINGNISADPLFVGGLPFDYHLQAGSPAIDAGNPDSAFNDIDGSRNDMGAYGGKTATGPQGSISINFGSPATNTTSVTLQLSAADVDGVAEMKFSTDNRSWSTPEAYVTAKDWSLDSGDGRKTIYVQYKDGLDNWSYTYSASILLDTVAPNTTASHASGAYGSALSVTLTATDEGFEHQSSGVSAIYYTTDGSTPTTSSPVYTGPINISADTTIKFFAVDVAGNIETVKSVTYTIITSGNITINGTGNYGTIQSAIDAASYGDTINVPSGVYHESIILKNGIIVEGANPWDTIIFGGNDAGDVVTLTAGSATIRGFTIKGAISGSSGIFVNYSGTTLTAINNIIIENDYGIRGSNQSNVIVKNNIIANNTYDGINVYEYATVENNVITNNGRSGWNDWSGGGTYTFDNNIIVNNDWTGFATHRDTPLTIQYNDVWNNTLGNYIYGFQGWGSEGSFTPSPGTGEISLDPLFSSDVYYTLLTTSPCIDAGNPSSAYNDLDASRNDMGIYGGPNKIPDDYSVPPLNVTTLTANDKPSDSGGAIVLEWTGYVTPADFSQFKIYRNSTSFSDVSAMTPIATTTSMTYTDGTTIDTTDYYYAITAVDAAGYENKAVTSVGPIQSVNNFAGDTTPPITSLSSSPSSPDGINGWFKTTPTLTLSRNEPGSTYYKWNVSLPPGDPGWDEYEFPITALEGENTLYYYSEDTAENSELVKSQQIKVDTQSPSDVTLSGNTVDPERIDTVWSSSTDSTSGVDHYDVYDEATDSLLATEIGLTYSFTSLSQNDTYSYYVKAVDEAGNESSASNTLKTSTIPIWTQPLFYDGEPNNDLASADVVMPRNIVPSTHFYGYIDNSTDEDWHVVYLREGQTVDVSIASVQSTGTELGWEIQNPVGAILYQQTGLGTSLPNDQAPLYVVPFGGEGWYVIRAWNVNGGATLTRYDVDVSVTPQNDTVCPTTPTNVTATRVSYTEVDLTWTASTDDLGPVGYAVADLNTGLIVKTSKTNSCTITGLTPGTTYDFAVGASDVGGNIIGPQDESSWVQVVTSIIDTDPPSAPANLAAFALNHEEMELFWDASTDNVGVTEYKVYKASDNSLVETTSELSYKVTGLELSTTYSYYVRAYDANNNESDPSNTVSATTFTGSGSVDTGDGQTVDLGNDASLIFDSVLSSGDVTLTVHTTPGHNPATNFRLLRGGYYDLITTCNYLGSITVRLPYDENEIHGKEENLKLFHWEDPDGWEDCTLYVDTVNNVIVGEVDSLSPFMVGEPFPGGIPTGANKNALIFMAFVSIMVGGLIILRTKHGLETN